MGKTTLKSRRLNQELKYRIINRAEDIVFKKRKTELSKQNSAVADQLYHHLYNDDVMKVINKFPQPCLLDLADRSYFRIYASTLREIDKKFTQGIPYMINFKFSDGQVRAMIGGMQELTKEILRSLPEVLFDKMITHAKEKQSLSDEVVKYKQKLRSLLDHVTTTKQLIEVLPEAEDWVRHVTETGCSNMPQADIASQVSELARVASTK